MAWVLLVIAGLFEVGFTTCLKLSDNFRNLGWSLGFFVCTILSFVLLNKAIQTIPLGTAYGVWTGIGAVGTALVGIMFYKESTEFWRIFFLVLLIGSLIGLKAVSK
jgi:quaternary ammonium compound-resistance protein SugE